MRRVKRYLMMTVAFCMLVVTLAGCGKEGDAQTGAKIGLANLPEKGRYEEKEMQLPEEIDRKAIIQLESEDDMPTLYVKTGQGTGTLGVLRYTYDGSWKESTPEEMKKVAITENEYNQIKVMKHDKDYFIYYTTTVDDMSHAELLKSKNGAAFETVTPADWLEENTDYPEYHYIEVPNAVAVNSNGVMLAAFYTKMMLYNTEDMSVVKNWEPKDSYYYDAILVNGENFILPGQNDMGQLSDLYVFDGKSDQAVEEITFTPNENGNTGFTALKDGTVIIACPDGMYQKKPDSKEFELFVNGAYTSFAMSSVWCTGLIGYDNDKYMASFGQNSNEVCLYTYEYNPELSNTPDKELTVYTLYSNSTLSQAAAVFTRKHPDTVVNIHVAFPNKYPEDYDGEENIEEELKKLNAALLAKGGEDILVLDRMNADTLADKGCLVDLSDVIDPLQESGALLGKIIDGERTQDGKLLRVPLRFATDIVVSRGIDAGTVSDLKSLADVMSKNEQSMIGPRTTDDLVDQFAPYFTDAIVKDKKLDTEELKTNLTYLKQIADNCGIVSDYGDSHRACNIWEIASRVDIAIHYDAGFAEAMFPLSGARLVKGTFAGFEKAFYPLTELAVNSNSAEQELAKEFIALAVSEEVQDCDFYDGYPINANSLVHLQHMDYSNYEAMTDIEVGEGQYEPFTIAKFDETEGNQLTEMCNQLEKRACVDTMISSSIKKAIPGYLDGSKTLEDTVKEIEESLHIYLAE